MPICRRRCPNPNQVVDDEAKRALDVLRDEQAAPRGQRGRGGSSRERNADEMRALGPALVLRALAENAPTVMYAHVALAFDLLWHVLLRDRVRVRVRVRVRDRFRVRVRVRGSYP